MHPIQRNILYVSSARSLWKSMDCGLSWNRINNSGANDMLFNSDNTLLYAVSKDVLYTYDPFASGNSLKAMDSVLLGITETMAKNFYHRLAISPATPNTLYVLTNYSPCTSEGEEDDCKEENTWLHTFNPANNNFSLLYSKGNEWFKSQQGFCLALAVSPTLNENSTPDLYVASVEAYASSDGGKEWKNISKDEDKKEFMHVDVHSLCFSEKNLLYIANDGGIYRRDNNTGIIQNLSDNLPVTQVHEISSRPDHFIIGTQDNGLMWKGSTEFMNASSGDVLSCAFLNNNVMVFSTTGVGVKGRKIPLKSNTPVTFYTNNELENIPLLPRAAGTLIMGAEAVYKVTDLITSGNVNPAPTITDISNNQLEEGRITKLMSPLAIPSTLYVAKSRVDDIFFGDLLYRTDNMNAPLPVWESLTDKLPKRLNQKPLLISDIIAPDPVNAGHLYITCPALYNFQKVYESQDGGNTWNNITYNITQNTIVYCIVADGKELYIGTDRGVYFLPKDSKIWFPLLKGMPIQIIKDLEVMKVQETIISNKLKPEFKDRKILRAATYGRGVWELDITECPKKEEETKPWTPPIAIALAVGITGYYQQYCVLAYEASEQRCNYDFTYLPAGDTVVSSIAVDDLISEIKSNLDPDIPQDFKFSIDYRATDDIYFTDGFSCGDCTAEIGIVPCVQKDLSHPSIQTNSKSLKILYQKKESEHLLTSLLLYPVRN